MVFHDVRAPRGGRVWLFANDVLGAVMTTRLERPLRREIDIDAQAYTLQIDAQGLKLVEKGGRKGMRALATSSRSPVPDQGAA